MCVHVSHSPHLFNSLHLGMSHCACRDVADAMVEKGLVAAGYRYVVMNSFSYIHNPFASLYTCLDTMVRCACWDVDQMTDNI